MASDTTFAGASRLDERGVSPALGFAIAIVLILVLAVSVGVMVGAIAEEPGPDATFEWSQSGSGADKRLELAHAGGAVVSGSELRLELDGTGRFAANATLSAWGPVRNGSTLTVGLVRGAVVVDGRVNGTAANGTAVIAFAPDGEPLERGVVVAELVDVEYDQLTEAKLVWQGSYASSELASTYVD
ncbi:type IV pilin [Halovivax limisalsi]|uniref:type IV pilin n=1 Tax=Halovivax limisalsi TaxID=1453760 RepID=UPI001FFC2BF1|nr:type IV pilin [Halovivax limisalsi]